MSKSNVLELCRLLELLKSIQKAYYEKKEILTIAKQHILQLTQRILLSFIQNAKKRIVSDKKYSEKRLDILSGLVLAANALNGPPSKERLLVASYGLTIANRMKTFKNDENVEDLLKKLELFSYIETRIKQASDCSYLYWHFNVLLPIYLTEVYESNAYTPNKIQFMILAVRDCIDKFVYTRHG